MSDKPPLQGQRTVEREPLILMLKVLDIVMLIGLTGVFALGFLPDRDRFFFNDRAGSGTASENPVVTVVDRGGNSTPTIGCPGGSLPPTEFIKLRADVDQRLLLPLCAGQWLIIQSPTQHIYSLWPQGLLLGWRAS